MKSPLDLLKSQTPDPHNENPSRRSSIDRMNSLLSHLRRFGWDLLGILLLLVAVLSLLGLSGISKGTLINGWVTLIQRSFGWGCYLLIVMVGLLGVACFRHIAGKTFPFKLSQIIAYEGAFFSLLALVALFGGGSLERADAGKDGGTIGWGLANLIPGFFGIVVYLLLFLMMLGFATGVFSTLYRVILSWSEPGVEPINSSNQQNQRQIPRSQELRNKSINPDEKPIPIQSNWRDDRLPPLNLLMRENTVVPDQSQIKAKAVMIECTLAEFGLPAKVIGFRVGPTVTQYALEPGFITKPGTDGIETKQKVRVAQISALSRDLALALSASRLRIETPVPGRSYVGIEVPNSDNAFVRLRSMLESPEFRLARTPLSLAIGRNVSGEPVFADLEKMPHLLIAGTTNSGKSVCITALTTCLVMNNTPHDLKLVMLDPKMVELVRFNGIPHLLGKVETEIERMLAVLRWALAEMDSRYRLLADARVRNLESYNRKMLQKKQPTLPRIVIMIDELADLMMSAPDQTEHSLIRLAQMARATGIHMVVATQRPSTDVVTGLIKANFPARISFAVASSIDSRVVLDTNGAEDLLGRGDMLFMDPTRSGLQRLQGIIISDSEVEKILTHWQKMVPVEKDNTPWESYAEETSPEENSDQLIEQAIEVVRTAGKASASLIQRRLRVGYPRAARLIDELEEMGIVGPSVGSGKDREVLIDPEPNDQEIDE